jgi:hypothetical protein
MAQLKSPAWMKKTPAPKLEERVLSGFRMKGWLGDVPLDEIRAYLDNRRTDKQVGILRRTVGKAVPSDDELFEFLKDDPELEIQSLANDIVLNGLREPVVISYDRVLLDGNRRYFAHRWISKYGKPEIRRNFITLRAWVPYKEYSDDRDKLRVIVEYNFLDDQKRDWSDYVKAKLLWEEYNDAKKNFSYDDLTQLYGGSGFNRAKIIEFIKTYEVIALFVASSSDPDSAALKTAENFIWFQQLQRSYRDEIRNDDEFQEPVFKNIRDDNIVRTDQLKNLRDLYKYKDAWTLFKKGDVDAAQDLRKFYARQQKDNGDLAMAEVVARLKSLVDDGRIEKVSAGQLAEFHKLANKAPGQISDVNQRIDYIVDRFDAITSAELAKLAPASLSKLRRALERVVKQASSTNK